MLVPTKKWWKSKMVWLGVLQTAGGAIELLTGILENSELGLAAVVSGVVTAGLRLVTKQPITVKGDEWKEVQGG
jgi:hypothetical protein